MTPAVLTRWASLCAVFMIAWQIAAKATRDSLFLSNFEVTQLPAMVVVASLLSMLTVRGSTLGISTFGPSRFMQGAFLTSAAALLGLWGLYFVRPAWSAVGLYLQIAMFGAVLVSGFWSVVNELFDPRTGKRSFVVIGRAATLGGLVGGLLAERVATWFSADALLPMLACFHVVCAVTTRQLATSSAPPEASERVAVLQVLKSRTYLQHLGLLVLLMSVASGLLDYWFKAMVVDTYQDEQLVRFFASFYVGVGLLTFAVQTVGTRWVLKTIGLGRAVALLPATVAMGGIAALLLPGIHTATALRTGEATMESSVYRSAYELLFVPLSPREKRQTKAVIDVGFRRAGDTLGGLVVSAALLAGAAAHDVMLGVMVALSATAVYVATLFQRGYVVELERSLKSQAGGIALFGDVADGLTHDVLHRTIGTMKLSDLDSGATRELFSVQLPGAASGRGSPSGPVESDPVVADVSLLRGSDRTAIRARLAAGLEPAMVGHAIPLLAREGLAQQVIDALAETVPATTGQLVDAMLDPSSAFAVRRRLPRALAPKGEGRAVDGLTSALHDERFEVRFQAAKVLAAIQRRSNAWPPHKDAVEAVVLAEAACEKSVWKSRRVLDQWDETNDAAINLVRQRSDRSTEHVFTLLSLMLPAEPVGIAYQGLQTDDARLRGTAMEYLDQVLSPQLRKALWPLLTDRPLKHTSATRTEVLDALMKSHKSIMVNLEKLAKTDEAP